MEQFPCAFEFSERLLITIHSHIYSCQFGNFIGNNQRERIELGWDLDLQPPSLSFPFHTQASEEETDCQWEVTASSMLQHQLCVYRDRSHSNNSYLCLCLLVFSDLDCLAAVWHEYRLRERTHSLWSYIWTNRADYINPLYRPNHSQTQGLLRPSTAPYCFKYVLTISPNVHSQCGQCVGERMGFYYRILSLNVFPFFHLDFGVGFTTDLIVGCILDNLSRITWGPSKRRHNSWRSSWLHTKKYDKAGPPYSGEFFWLNIMISHYVFISFIINRKSLR